MEFKVEGGYLKYEIIEAKKIKWNESKTRIMTEVGMYYPFDISDIFQHAYLEKITDKLVILDELFVASEYRRKGIATVLVESFIGCFALELICVAAGIYEGSDNLTDMEVLVRLSELDNFYSKLGFRNVTDLFDSEQDIMYYIFPNQKGKIFVGSLWSSVTRSNSIRQIYQSICSIKQFNSIEDRDIYACKSKTELAILLKSKGVKI